MYRKYEENHQKRGNGNLWVKHILISCSKASTVTAFLLRKKKVGFFSENYGVQVSKRMAFVQFQYSIRVYLFPRPGWCNKKITQDFFQNKVTGNHKRAFFQLRKVYHLTESRFLVLTIKVTTNERKKVTRWILGFFEFRLR